MLSTLPLLLALTRLVLVAEADVCSTEECPAKEYTYRNNAVEEVTCSLFLAPSSIEEAGLGIYTAKNIPYGDSIGDDLFIPIMDHLKTLPYRGQQRFLSWLGYVWPKKIDAFYHTFDNEMEPEVPYSFYGVDQGLNAAVGTNFYNGKNKRVSAFSPGIASLANSHEHLYNIKKTKPEKVSTSTGKEAFTPHGGVKFFATENIPAGSELFLNYGEEWHERYQELVNSPTEYEGAKEFTARVVDNDELEFKDEAAKRKNTKDRIHEKEVKRRLQKLLGEEIHETVNEHGNSAKFVSPESNDDATLLDEDEEEHDQEENEDEDEEEDENEYDEDTDSTLMVEWLENNGVCIDNIYPGTSTIPSAGKGAFAKTFISKGSLIAPTPLVVLKRQDLYIYESDISQKRFQNVVNLNKLKGQELLLNYCYGHLDSELLLLPYSPVVNFINHNGTAPNAIIRWPQGDPWAHRDPTEWLGLHPLDVLDQSGKLMMEFVALRDILPGEEIFIDYGRDWEDAWTKHGGVSDGAFRHEIGVPTDFFPNGWKNKSVVYELAPLEDSLKPSELSLMRWAHNGKPVQDNYFRARLHNGTSARSLDFSNEIGATALYKDLITTNALEENEWFTYDSGNGEEWYVHRFESSDWDFNVHYHSAWNEAARMHFLRFLGQVGFDALLDAIGNKFGLDNLTCWHPSLIGVNDCDNSVMHADVHSTDNKGFIILYPYLLIEGSKPELDIQGGDANIVLSVKYEEDVAVVLGDYGFHRTSPVDYSDNGGIRLVVSNYCSQIDETNHKVMKWLYDSEHPAPFMDQFDLPIKEFHWGNGHTLPK